MRDEKLKPCPFCGGEPEVSEYPTFIKVFCPECKKEHRDINAFGNGVYSDWCKTQESDEKGLITIDERAIANPEARREVYLSWNKRTNPKED